MDCAKCGAKLKVGCVYCSVCGHEAQIVPDYNVLEDDYLNNILTRENRTKVSRKASGASGTANKRAKNKTKKKPYYLISISIAVIAAGIIIALCISQNINNQRHNSFDYQYEQGLLAQKAEDYDTAIRYFQRALELDEGNLDVMFELVAIYRNQNDVRMEENTLLEILERDAENLDAYSMLIKLYDKQEQYSKIIQMRDELTDTSFSQLFEAYEVEAPEFSKTAGIYSEESEVILTAKPGCTIYYALDNIDPIESGRTYAEAIPLREGETVIRAVAKDKRGIYSDVVYAKYVVEFIAPDIPKVKPASGSYSTPQMIEVDVPKDSTVYYTWDGSTPTSGSIRYEGTIEMPVGNNVLSLIAIDKHGLTSRVAKYNYIYLPVEE